MRIRYVIEVCDATRKGLRKEKGEYRKANRAEVIEAAEQALNARWAQARAEGPEDARHDPKNPPVFNKGSQESAYRQAADLSEMHGEAWVVCHRVEGFRSWLVGTPRAFSGETWRELIEEPGKGEGLRDVFVDGELDTEW